MSGSTGAQPASYLSDYEFLTAVDCWSDTFLPDWSPSCPSSTWSQTSSDSLTHRIQTCSCTSQRQKSKTCSNNPKWCVHALSLHSVKSLLMRFWDPMKKTVKNFQETKSFPEVCRETEVSEADMSGSEENLSVSCHYGGGGGGSEDQPINAEHHHRSVQGDWLLLSSLLIGTVTDVGHSPWSSSVLSSSCSCKHSLRQNEAFTDSSKGNVNLKQKICNNPHDPEKTNKTKYV